MGICQFTMTKRAFHLRGKMSCYSDKRSAIIKSPYITSFGSSDFSRCTLVNSYILFYDIAWFKYPKGKKTPSCISQTSVTTLPPPQYHLCISLYLHKSHCSNGRNGLGIRRTRKKRINYLFVTRLRKNSYYATLKGAYW